MAIDTKSLTQLITEFRAYQAKDSITPENLGHILQRIVDLLSTAGTAETVEQLQTLLNALKTNGNVVTNVRQGSFDRNHIYAIMDFINLTTGESGQSSGLFIQQATTEHAGAMRAQQVTDLNTARNNINGKILPQLETHESAILAMQKALGIGDGSSVTNIVNTSQISCEVVNHQLHIKGASKLTAAGYVPYLFRLTRKRNHYHHRERNESNMNKKYCPQSKGWHLYGSCHTVTMERDTLLFSTNSKPYIHKVASDYSPKASTLVSVHTHKKGYKSIGWGRSTIILNNLENAKKPEKMRMIRLRYAVGFAKRMTPGKIQITPANLVSSLAEFSLVFDPNTQEWEFSK